VETDEGIDRRFYELCALTELKNRLRSGDIWVSGSRQFKDFDAYLLAPSRFHELRDDKSLTRFLHHVMAGARKRRVWWWWQGV
jgi:hypothetical protein